MKHLLLLCAVFALGVSAQASSVTLTCTASTTLGVTYDFYRATVLGGPYSQINLSPESSCSFLDTIVSSGVTYFYVARAYDSVNLSSNSNQVSVTIPRVPAPPTNLTATVK